MALEVISWAIFHNISLVINLILEGLSIILHKDNKRTFKYNLKFLVIQNWKTKDITILL